MSSFEDAKQALGNILNNHSPSSIIEKGFVTLFHDFFARCSPDEVIQFLPAGFLSKLRSYQFEQLHDCLRPSLQPQDIRSTSNALHNVPSSAHTIIAGGPNPSSCEPNASITCPQSHPRHDKQLIAFTSLTPESFRKQERQDIQPSVNALKLVRCIKEVARKGLRESEFYRALWDNGEDLQPQSHIADPLHRYGALQQMINVSAETEVKNIYRQRIAHILGAHELEVISRSISDSELQGVHRKSLVVDKLAESLGKTRQEIHQHNTKRRHYLLFYFKIGPGAIPLLGDNANKELLEKSLTDDDVTYVLEYIQNSLPEWLSLCARVNFEVAISILKGLQITGWDGKSYYETSFMNHLGKFINLDAFQKLGEFRPVSGEESSSKSQSRDSPLERPAETRSGDIPCDESSRARKRRRTGHEVNSTFSASETPATVNSIQGNIPISEASPSDYGRFGVSPRGSSTDFESRQDPISQIPNPSNLSNGESAMPQKQVKHFVDSNEQGGSSRRFLRQPVPSSAFVFYPTERNDARTPSTARHHHGSQTCFLQDPRVSTLTVREPGVSSQCHGGMGILGSFSFLDRPFSDVQFNPYDILDPPCNDVQFNPYDILDPPFSDVQFNPHDILDPPFSDVQFNPYDILDPPCNDVQFNPYDILDPPFSDVQFNPYDILDPPFSDVQFNPYDILDPSFSDVQFNPLDILDPPSDSTQSDPNGVLDTSFDGAQFNPSDNSSQGWPPSGSFEPCGQVSCALGVSA